ncbi:uncharacterized protein LOC117108601 [Anneissia japonica]|uniref:uncharacterized protein LOC117108601 n=1 Tax=Anneissia japonica TaxID=1529436 RepID=UPI0014256A21|nr:uncharacterized protein LOC117108601 [Anneissia japonica]
MKPFQAAQILTLSVILSSITSSVFACWCPLKHPQYHYCTSDYVFRAVITEFEEVPKSILEEPIAPAPKVLKPTTQPTTNPITNPTMSPTMNLTANPTTNSTTDITTNSTRVNTTKETEIVSTLAETERINSTLQTASTPRENSSTILDITSRDTVRESAASSATDLTDSLSSSSEEPVIGMKIQFEKHPKIAPIQQIMLDARSASQVVFESYTSSSEFLNYPEDYLIRYRMKVTKVFKGAIDIGHTEIFTLADRNQCGMKHLKNHTSYLFTVSEGDDKRIHATDCDWVPEYKELTDEQVAGLFKSYGKFCKACNNAESCSNHPWYSECDYKYSSCFQHDTNRGKFGCTWAESAKHRSCREEQQALHQGTAFYG